MALICSLCTRSVDVPNAVSQTMPTAVGTSSTPMMNSRIVRPRETRAMNIPTKGDHEIHHAQ